jgi:hypothetical protein
MPQATAADLDLGVGGRLVDAAAGGNADHVRDLGWIWRRDSATSGEGHAGAQ